MSIFRRLLSDAVVYSLTPLLSSLVGFLLVPVYTRTFSPTDYGAVALVNNATTLVTILAVFGLDNSSAIWFWDHPSDDERSRTWSTWLAFTTAVSFAFALIAVALHVPLARWLFADERLSSLWLLFAFNIIAASVPRVAILWFRMHRLPWRAVGLGALTSIGTATFGILFVVYWRIGLPGVIAGQVMGSWLGTLAAVIALRSVWKPRAVDRARLPPMLRLSAPLVLMANLNWVMSGAVAYFVNFVCSREDAGLYQVASSLASILGLLIFAFDQAWAPLALSIREEDVARRVYGVTLEAVLVVGLLLAFAATALAEPALLVITHPQYVAAQWVLALLALNTVLINIPSVLSVTFARQKVTMPLAKATAAGAVVTIVLVPLLASRFGKEGAALGVLIGTLTIVVLAFNASQKVFPIDIRLPRIGVAVLLIGGWTVAFLVLRTHVGSLIAKIATSTAMVLGLAGALGAFYRRALGEAWAEGRANRVSR